MAGEESRGPRYRQIAGDLRDAITSGKYQPGERIPTKAALCSRYGVAVNTVERALEELRREGWIRTVHGSGSFACDPAAVPRDPEPRDLLARIEALEGRVSRLEPADQPAPLPVVVAVVTSGDGVLLSRRHDGRPPVGFIAGEIEPGESPAQAGEREVKEESGLRITAGHEIGRRIHPLTARTLIYMAARPAGRDTAVHVGDDSELSGVWWADLAEAEHLMPDLYAPVREHLARVLRH